MTTFKVGGAVRDGLLGLQASDTDWLVTGVSAEQMLQAGYLRVGRDFSVFLHPETHEEYALPRASTVSAAPGQQALDQALDQALLGDLRARDLTINAMARDEGGTLIDPWGGATDLHNRLLRHVSDAFADDPIRVLRVARFKAKFAAFGFEVAPETQDLMRSLVDSGAVDRLQPERVWKETERALMADVPSLYFTTLRQCGALAKLMPELDRLFGVPQPLKHHPEGDTGVHVMMCIDGAAAGGAPLPVRFAALLHDLGKGLTAREEWPQHRGHEEAGVPLVHEYCARLRVPNDLRDLAAAVSREHLRVHQAEIIRPGTMVDLLSGLRGFRDRQFFEHALWACRCDAQGRLGLEDRPYPQMDILRKALELAAPISFRDLPNRQLEGAAIAEAIRSARIAAVIGRTPKAPSARPPEMSM